MLLSVIFITYLVKPIKKNNCLTIIKNLFDKWLSVGKTANGKGGLSRVVQNGQPGIRIFRNRSERTTA